MNTDFGLGQITITSKFNNFVEIKKLHKDLYDWAYDDRYDPKMQIKAVLIFNKSIYSRITGAATTEDRLSFSYAAYNGGVGGLLSDRRVCQGLGLAKCNPNIWKNNVEHTSNKSKVRANGYGKSFFEINREYVINIMEVRRVRYDSYFDNFK